MFQYTDAWPAEIPNGMDEREVYDLKLPYQKMAGADRRILFVFEFVPTEDLHSGKLLGGTTGRLFAKLLSQYEEHFGTWSWTAINFNSWKTFGKSMGFVQSSNEMFAKRVRQYIRKVKPTHVVFLGASGLQHLVPYLAQDDYLEHNLYGVPLPLSPKDPSLGNITLVPSLHNIVADQDPQGNGPSNLLGYVAKCLRNGVLGRNPYSVGWNEREPKFKLNLIKTVKQFDGMMKEMRAAKAVAIDTETSGLGRVTSKLLTAQFCFADDTAWFLPILHKDAGFSRSKLAHIASELRDYFEGKNKNRYHIYANGKFDLVQFKNNLRVRYFKNRIWDVQHADYCFHPNTMVETAAGRVPIETLRAGDSVWSYNHATGQRELKPLLACSKHTTKEAMYAIAYEGGQLCVTATHKVWSNDREDYVEAQHLRIGEDVELFKPNTLTAVPA